MDETFSHISPAAIIYGAEDLFVPNVHHHLTSLMLAVTVMDLEEQGMLSLHMEPRKVLGIVIHILIIRGIWSDADDAVLPERPIEIFLCGGLGPDKEEMAASAVRAAFPGSDPRESIIETAVQELAAHGCYDDEEREAGGIGGFLRKVVHASPKVEHVLARKPDQFALVRELAPVVVRKIEAARDRNAPLWEAMLEAFQKGFDPPENPPMPMY